MSAADAWAHTPAGAARYKAARAEAQRAANADGFDRGLERNDLMKSFNVLMLPRRENRNGHELRCEVVSCEDLSRCQPGHGPKVTAAPAKRPRTKPVVPTQEQASSVRGYPPHDHPMHAYLTGKDMRSCAGPLVLPEQAGAKLAAVCNCGRVESDHAIGKGCAAGFTLAPGCLFCAKCKTFVAADEDQIGRARTAAKAEGFRSGAAPLTEPQATKTVRVPLDRSKITMDLFPQLPQYHAKVCANGTAR